ncbi:MAG: isochorismate synthase [Halobacteriales archaeon SW_9_67_25]|nr:MAG: isochorismate synthase [Halobacteriales archaeon SW_9_67_25]
MERARGDGRRDRSGVTGLVKGREVADAPVRSFLAAVETPRFAWSDGTTTIAAGGSAATIRADGPDRFERVREAGTALFDGLETPESLPVGARQRLYGGFAFHEAHTDPPAGETWDGFPGASFVLPAVQLSLTADGAWLTAAGTGANAERRVGARIERWDRRLASLPELVLTGTPGIRREHPTPSREGWRRQVVDAVGKIRAGDLRKVVLAQELRAELAGPVDVAGALTDLGSRYPGCYRFLVEPDGGGTFFGATPERLVSLGDRTVKTEALAGSTGRGETIEEDEWLAGELRDSEKDVHEHELVVDAIRSQLARVAEEVTTGDRTVRKLATVQHLQTPVRAELAGEEHVLSLVEALHPTPAVGGLPPDAALGTIRETETFDRGWYAAPVGWFDADGDGTFAVAIRSALARDRTATLFAGAGIVADSDPDIEWDELQLKYGPMRDVLE